MIHEKKKHPVLYFLICVTFCFAANDLFEKYAGKDEVISFTVPKSMLMLIPDIDANGLNVKALKDHIDTVEIYTSQSQSVSTEMKNDFKSLINSGYSQMLQDNKNNITIWVKEKEEVITEFVAVTETQGIVGVVRILGQFTAEDIQQSIK